VALDPSTPVLVGAAAVTQRPTDLASALGAVDLMHAAAVAAAADAGAPGLLAACTIVGVPEGTWACPDPGRLLAARWGATARTWVAAVGVLQQDLIGEACAVLARGDAEVVVIVGGEARARQQAAATAGVEVGEPVQADVTVPDRAWQPTSLGLHDLELVRNAVTPTTAYALMEQAYAGSVGEVGDATRRRLGRRYERFAAVAATNVDAWDRTPYTADALVTPDEQNRMIDPPYTKLLCSQWNVDQAAALVLCRAEVAGAHGVPRDRWVFPWSSAVDNRAVPVIERAAPGASHVAVAALDAALDGAGLSGDDLAHVDLYSCFPIAVQLAADHLGLADDDLRPGTLTGGMSLAGGPLNNYVLQAMVPLVRAARAEPTSVGLSTSVSGFLHKYGAGTWSASPPARPFRHRAIAADGPAPPLTRPVDEAFRGRGTVATWTVDHLRGVPHRAVALVDTPGGARTLASTGDGDTVAAMCHGSWIGRAVDVAEDGSFLPA